MSMRRPDGAGVRWRLASRGFALLTAGAVAFAAVFGGDAPLTLAYWLGGLYVFAFVWVAASALGVRVAVAAGAPRVLCRGQTASLRVEAWSRWPWPVTCTVRWAPGRWGEPAGAAGPEDAPTVCVVPPGRTAAVRVETDPLPRGVHPWPAIDVEWRDPFGILAAQRRLTAAGRIVVGPQRRRVPRGSETARRVGAAAGTQPLAAPPDFTQWYGIRPFRDGDDRRLIHWRTSARRGRPHVLEFQRAWARGVALAVDPDPDGRLDAWEAAIDAVYSWGVFALERGMPVWLWQPRAATQEAPMAGVIAITSEAQLAEALAGLRPHRDPRFVRRLASIAETAPRPALVIVGAASLVPARAREWARLAPEWPPLVLMTFDGRPRSATSAFTHEAFAGAEAFGPAWPEDAENAGEEATAIG